MTLLYLSPLFFSACESGKNTDSSTEPSSETSALPTEMIGDLEVIITGTVVDLSWSLPDTDPLLAEVRLIRTTDAAATSVEDGTLLYSGLAGSHTDSSLTETGTYHYTVFTCNDSDGCMEEGVSIEATVVFPPTSMVSDFTATNNSGTIELSWTNPSDDSSFDSVLIRKAFNQAPGLSDGDEVCRASGPPCVDTPPYSGDWFYTAFTCNADNLCMEDGVSISINITTGDVSPVTDFVATAGDGEVTLSWTPSSEANYAGVKICRDTLTCENIAEDCTAVFTGSDTDNSFTDSSVTNLTEYCYRAYAFDGGMSHSVGVDDFAVPNNGTKFWWDYTAGGNAHDTIFTLHVDQSDNVYVSGSHNSRVTVQGDTSNGDYSNMYDLTNYRSDIDFGGGIRPFLDDDQFVVKLDSDGNYLWDWYPYSGCGSEDRIHGVATDAESNVYLGGHFGYDTIQLDQSTEMHDLSVSTVGGYWVNPYIVKLDSNGNFQWEHHFGVNGAAKLGGLGANDEGDSFLCGKFKNTMDMGNGSESSSGGTDIFVTSLNTDGQYNWHWTAGSSGPEKVLRCHWKHDQVYVVGSYSGAIDFGGGTRPWLGGNDIFAVVLDEEGNYLWDYTAAGDSTSDDYAYGITSDADGNVYLTGKFKGTMDFGGGPVSSNGEYDFFVVKLDASGNYLWDYTAGGSQIDFARDVAVSEDGVFVVGTYESDSVDFGGGPVTNSGAPISNPFPMKEGDYFVLELDHDGNFKDVRVALSGGTGTSMYGDDFARAIGVSRNGTGLYVAGHFSDPIDFGGGTVQPASDPSYMPGRDVFLMKLIR